MEMTSRKNCLQITTPLPIYRHYKISSHYQVNNKRLVTNKVRIPGVIFGIVKLFPYIPTFPDSFLFSPYSE